MNLSKTFEAIHAVILEANTLLDMSEGGGLGGDMRVDGSAWKALSDAMQKLDALIPEAERPASPSWAVRLLQQSTDAKEPVWVGQYRDACKQSGEV